MNVSVRIKGQGESVLGRNLIEFGIQKSVNVFAWTVYIVNREALIKQHVNVN